MKFVFDGQTFFLSHRLKTVKSTLKSLILGGTRGKLGCLDMERRALSENVPFLNICTIDTFFE